MTEEDRDKGADGAEASPQEQTTEMKAAQADATTPGADPPRAPGGGPDASGNSTLSERLRIAAVSAAAVVVAFLLFIAPGDRVLGFESEGHDMERTYDDHGDRDEDGPDMDDHGDYDDHYEDYGPGGLHGQGGPGGPVAPPQATPPPAAPPVTPQGGAGNR